MSRPIKIGQLHSWAWAPVLADLTEASRLQLTLQNDPTFIEARQEAESP